MALASFGLPFEINSLLKPVILFCTTILFCIRGLFKRHQEKITRYLPLMFCIYRYSSCICTIDILHFQCTNGYGWEQT